MTGLARSLGRRARDDDGSAVVELVLVASVFVTFGLLLVFVGRVNGEHAEVEAAARYSARTISIARDQVAAVDAAQADAERTVGAGSSGCRSMTFDHRIEVDRVVVTISCTVDLSDVGLFELPGTWPVTATAEEPRDRWREATSP
jgi:Flp pilus assembly protein TadG